MYEYATYMMLFRYLLLSLGRHSTFYVENLLSQYMYILEASGVEQHSDD